MRVKRTEDGVAIVMSGAEGRVFLEELLDVPGGARLPKLRQVCRGLGLWHKEEKERTEEFRRKAQYGRKVVKT